MKIRPLRYSDAKEAAKLFEETFKQLTRYYIAKELNIGLKKYSAKGLQEHMKEGKYLFRVAEDRGKIVGVVVCDFPVQGLCWIEWLAVKKSYRRRGVGSMLARSLETPVQGKWNKIMTRSRMGNNPSINLFSKKLGFTKVATLRRHTRKRNAYTWEKQIS